jgi:hypothetical protein
MPIGAGFIVAYLQGWGFSPALKFLTRAIEGVVDDTKNAALPTSYWQVCGHHCRMVLHAAIQPAKQLQPWLPAGVLLWCLGLSEVSVASAAL